MIAILSPAETLDFDAGVATDRYSRPEFLDDAADLATTAGSLGPDGLAELMNINGDLAQLNAERFAAWRTGLHDSPGAARQAIAVFRGEVYRGLDADSLSEDDFAFAQDHLRILSGLYGVLRPLDLMLPYRLEMGIRLRNSRGSSLYDFWGARIAEHLNTAVQRSGSRILVNLASQEYFRAVAVDDLECPVVTPQFKERRDDGHLRTVAVYAKQQRGKMARFLVSRRLADVEALKDYREDGYRFDPASSDNRTWVFVR